MNSVDKKYVILGSLCALVLMLAVGYAAFNAVLNIKGTTNISSNWDVKITGIEKVSSKGSTDKEGTPKYDNLSATFNTDLVSPGDYATYKIEITNNGSLDAKLTKIDMPANTNNDIIFYLNKNQNNEDIAEALKQNDTLFKKGETGNVGYVYVTVLYKDYGNQQTATNKTASMTISFDFEQADKAIATTNKIVYRTGNGTLGIGESIDGKETATDPSDFGIYLKHEIDSENKVVASYVCFDEYFGLNEEYCMQGGSPDYYGVNKALLQSLESWFINSGGSCTFDDSSASCNGGGFNIGIGSGGYVTIRGGGAFWGIYSDGISDSYL